MEAGHPSRRGMHRRGRGLAVLGTEVTAVDSEFGNDRGGRAEADVEFLQCVVIDEIELNVLVAAALAGCGGRFAEEVDRGPLRVRFRRLR